MQIFLTHMIFVKPVYDIKLAHFLDIFYHPTFSFQQQVKILILMHWVQRMELISSPGLKCNLCFRLADMAGAGADRNITAGRVTKDSITFIHLHHTCIFYL